MKPDRLYKIIKDTTPYIQAVSSSPEQSDWFTQQVSPQTIYKVIDNVTRKSLGKIFKRGNQFRFFGKDKITPLYSDNLESAADHLYKEITGNFPFKKLPLSDLKSIIKELITETLFNKRIKIRFGDNIFPALISKNPRGSGESEKDEYRITWFDNDTKIPIFHLSFGELTLKYILKNKDLPLYLKKPWLDIGVPCPNLIFEMKQPMKTANYIIVGTITPDEEVVAKYGGSHAIYGMRSEYNWRYNPYTEMVYWHNPHSLKYEDMVKAFVERTGNSVSWQVTMSNIQDKEHYDNLWRDAHGVD